MENLYLNGYLKQDKVWEALHQAKYKQLLKGIEDRELRAFLEGFNKVIVARKYALKDKISHDEVADILEIMRRDHTDIVNDQDLQNIGDILLNKDFRF